MLVPGISHGFLQFVSLYTPKAGSTSSSVRNGSTKSSCGSPQLLLLGYLLRDFGENEPRINPWGRVTRKDAVGSQEFGAEG